MEQGITFFDTAEVYNKEVIGEALSLLKEKFEIILRKTSTFNWSSLLGARQWYGNYRLLAKEYEMSTQSSQADPELVMIHVMLRRLQPLNHF